MTKFNCRPRGWPIEAHSSSTKRRASTKWMTRGLRLSGTRNRSGETGLGEFGFHCDTVLDIVSRPPRLVFLYFSPDGKWWWNGGSLKNFFWLLARLSAGRLFSKSKNCRPSRTVNGKIRGRSRGIWAISIETIVVFNLKYYAALSVRLRKLRL